MNAVEFLTRSKGIKKRMEALEERICRLRSNAERTTPLYELRIGSGTSIYDRYDYLSKLEEAQREYSELNIIYEDVIESIERLGERQHREILWLHYIDCMSRKAIASQLKISTTWVAKQHDKAVGQLHVPEKYAIRERLCDTM